MYQTCKLLYQICNAFKSLWIDQYNTLLDRWRILSSSAVQNTISPYNTNTDDSSIASTATVTTTSYASTRELKRAVLRAANLEHKWCTVPSQAWDLITPIHCQENVFIHPEFSTDKNQYLDKVRRRR